MSGRRTAGKAKGRVYQTRPHRRTNVLTHILPHPLEDDMACTLTETPLDCAALELRRHVPGHDYLWYLHEASCIVQYGRRDRTGLERAVLHAYHKRESQWRAARREGVS
jgi:hypothetical protein